MSALPTYTMQTLLLPIHIRKELEKMMRCFLWGMKMWFMNASVSWKDIGNSKDFGGMGFKDIYLFNKAMVMKLG